VEAIQAAGDVPKDNAWHFGYSVNGGEEIQVEFKRSGKVFRAMPTLNRPTIPSQGAIEIRVVVYRGELVQAQGTFRGIPDPMKALSVEAKDRQASFLFVFTLVGSH
jgi:hypothetical protein